MLKQSLKTALAVGSLACGLTMPSLAYALPRICTQILGISNLLFQSRREAAHSVEAPVLAPRFDALVERASRLVTTHAQVSHEMPRGMVISPAELRHVLENGLETTKTQFKSIYMTDDPFIAIHYMAQRSFAERPLSLYVIFVIDTRALTLVPTRDHNFKTERNIPASAITSFYVFDKDRPRYFPFVRFSK